MAAPKAPVAPVAPVPVPKTAAALTTIVKREPVYRLDAKATRSNVTAQSFVTRGAHAKSGVASLVYVNGDTQSALPLAVVAQAIIGQVIDRAEVEYLWSLADAK